MGRIASAVGIAVTGRERAPDDPRGPGESLNLQKAMENAVLSAHQQGVDDPEQIKRMMNEAKARERRWFRENLAKK